MARRLHKQRYLLDFALSSLWRRKGKNLALLGVYSLLVFVLASVLFFTQALKREAALVLAASPELIVQKLAAGRHDLIPAAYAERLREIRGVSRVSGRLWGYYYDARVRANYTVMAPEEVAVPEQAVLVGAGIARGRHLSRGSTLTFQGYDGTPRAFQVRGVLSPESELLTADLVLMAAADVRRLFGLAEGLYTDLTVAVNNPREVATVAAKIQELLPDTRPILRDEIRRTYEAAFDWRAGILLSVFSGALLAFLIFAWDKAAGLSAEERREIGILKAMGWETGEVLQLKFWEGAVVSLTAFFMGTLAAYLHVFVAAAPLLAPVLQGWSVLYPRFRLTPFIGLFEVAILFFFTVVPYTAATIVPTWRAAGLEPDQVMRS